MLRGLNLESRNTRAPARLVCRRNMVAYALVTDQTVTTSFEFKKTELTPLVVNYQEVVSELGA